MSEPPVINWTRPKLERLKTAYQREVDAQRDGLSVFSFDGHEFVLWYAKYLIEYLEGQFK